ncbi:MAG: flagellar basal body-associated FliL family protein [Hyphomicrobiales bacterium]|nr:flagellar basal body-associated FliL family protein [Hyphomicrobiales bacterium]
MSNAATAPNTPIVRSGLSLRELLIVVLLGGCAGAVFGAIGPTAKGTDGTEAAAATQAKEPSTIYDLPAIVTNLGSPQETWIRLEGSIIFDPRTLPHPEAAAAEIGEDILAYLRTATLKQLEGPLGLQSIRQDLNERAVTRTGGKVREFVIRTLVVQ